MNIRMWPDDSPPDLSNELIRAEQYAGKLEEANSKLEKELQDSRAAARFVWACGKHRMWINYREEAMKKWPWMDSDEDPS